jgi:DNA adenine methylase
VLAKEKTEPLPFVKWAGGKRWLAAQIGKIKPQGWSGRYYEPFVGGGALFFALQPKRATLSDANADLIATYLAIKEDPDAVIETLRTYPFDEEFFYRLRDQNPRRAHKIAARFL